MAIKPVGSFTPALKPHAEWIDQNVGNKDGKVQPKELEAYKAKFPDATMYEPLKAELKAYRKPSGKGGKAAETTVGGNGPVAVGAGGGVLGFRLAQAAPTTASANAALEKGNAAHGIRQSLPVDKLTGVGATPGGEVFNLDSASVAGMEVRVREVRHSKHGDGTELQLRLTNATSLALADAIAKGTVAATESPFQLEKATFENGTTVLGAAEAYQPQQQGGAYGPLKAWVIEKEGKFSVEFIPSKDKPQAYRDKVRVRVFGATDAERKQNLQAAMAAIKMPAAVADADTAQLDRLNRLSLLRMVAPARAEELGSQLAEVPVKDIEQALKEAGVDDDAIKRSMLVPTFGGHAAPVNPWLGEKYAELGVRGIMVGVREVEFAAKVLTSDGLMSSLERYGRGIHKTGASLTSDEQSGGAEFAFTRLVTDNAIKGGKSISSSYGAGTVQLVSTGDAMKAQLSRTDWHAYANDSFGTTVSRSQAEGPNADPVAKQEYARRTSKFTDRPVLGELVAQVNGDKVVPGSYGGAGSWANNNEACFKNGVPAHAWTHAIVGDENTRQQLIAKLKESGLSEVGGKPLEDFVVVASDWKAAAPKLGLAVPS